MIDGIIESKMISSGTSLVVQWLRLHTANIGGLGLIPGQRTRSHMPQPNKQMKKLISSESKILNQSLIRLASDKLLFLVGLNLFFYKNFFLRIDVSNVH